MKYLFMCVHPDDLEFSCANLISHLAKKGKDVEILSLTKGEFGIFEEEWKGPRLGKIRVTELQHAATVNGLTKEKVHFGNIIDGFVKFDRIGLKEVQAWLNKIQPDILFTPEAYFTYYWHPDHINSGRLAYYIYTHQENFKLIHPIKKLVFYTSARANFVWPFNDCAHAGKSLYQHQSQWWLLKWNEQFYPLEKWNFRKDQIGRWKYGERYRIIRTDGKEPVPKRLTKGLIGLISTLNVINPPEPHFVVPDMSQGFGKQVAQLRKHYHFKD